MRISSSGPGAVPRTAVSRRVPVDEVHLDQPPGRAGRVAGLRDEQPRAPAVGQHGRADRLPSHLRAPEDLPDGAVGVDRAHPQPGLVGAGGQQQRLGRRRGGDAPPLPALPRVLEEARRVRGVHRPAEDLAGERVADEHRPAAVGEGAERPSAAEGLGADHAAVVDERGQEGVPGLRGVLQPEALGGQEVSEVQRLGGARQRRQPVGVRGQGGVLGNGRGPVGQPLGAHGQHGGHERDHQHGRQSAGQPPEPAAAAGLGPGPLLRGAEFRVRTLLRRVEELALPGGELGLCGTGPVQRRAEPGTAVQLVFGPSPALPLLRGGCQVPADGATGGVLLQPPGQARPAGQQRLVRHVEPLAVERQQPARHEGVDHRAAHRTSVAVEVELLQPGGAPDERTALVGVGQPDEQSAGGLPLFLVQCCPGLLRGTGQGSRDAAGLQVAGEGEPIPPPALPRTDQRGREQGQRPRSPEDVGDHRIHELVLDSQPDGGRRLPDDVAQFGLVQRRDEDHRGPEPLGEGCVLGEPADMVTADRDDAPHDDPVVQQALHRVEESGPLPGWTPGAHSSSNWSQTSTTGAAGGSSPARLVSASTGWLPGVTTTAVHASLPGSAPCASAGSKPARTSEDLPAPLEPDTATSGTSTSRATSRVTMRSRPWKRPASVAW